MAGFGALKAANHLSELTSPLVTGETGVGAVTAAARQALAVANLGITSTIAELNSIDNSAIAMSPGSGANGMDFYGAGARQVGSVFYTQMFVDFDGLLSGNAGGDIIGESAAANCHIGQVTAAINGTVKALKVTVLETPAAGSGDADVDLFFATVGTGSHSAAISGLTETQITDSGGWAAGDVILISDPAALPTADTYLYLVSQGTGNTAYTAGMILIEMWGV